MISLSLYIVIAVYSLAYSFRRLHRPGVSASVRNLFLKKHFLYVMLFIIIWMIQQSNNYYYLFNPSQVDLEIQTDLSRFNSLHMLGKYLGFTPRGGPSSTNDSNFSDNTNPVTIVSGVMTFSTGIVMTFARLIEPLFKVLLVEVIYLYWGALYEPEKEGLSKE